MPTPSVYPEHFCLTCGVRLVPRVFARGQREHPGRFARRKYCSQSCGRHHPRRALVPNRASPGTMLVPLTQDQYAIIDTGDAERVGQHPWHARQDSNGSWYATGKINGQRVWLHRFILEPPEHLEVDHIDRNPLNCTRANMRLATRQQQCANRAYASQSGYRGVSPVSGSNTWQARARYQGRLLHLGSYATPEEAARVVDVFWRTHGTGYDYLNSPDDT